MTCAMCSQPIQPGDVNMHHPVPRSDGGIETEPTHRACHIAHHSTSGDFKSWGRLGGKVSALSRQWAFNLKGVRSHPAYELSRAFNRAMYAEATR